MSAIKELSPNFFFIERGWLNGNHFALVGEDITLIDTGYIAHVSDTLHILAGLGVEPERVNRIITTHTHCDHIGGHAHIQRLSNCEILLSHIDKHFIDNRNDWYTWWRYYNQEAEFFRTDKALRDGDRVSLGEAVFEVLHTPGHASGGIVLFDRDSATLISSDALWAHDLGTLTPRIEGNMCVFQALESLDRIEGLNAKIAYPGHGPIIENVPAAIERCRARLRGFLENPQSQGRDQIKKIMVYTLLMKKEYPEDKFFDYLMTTYWYPETVDLFFSGRYEPVYRGILEELLDRGALYTQDGFLKTGVKP